MSPHDYLELEVFSEMERLAAEDEEFCGCTKCRADVAAFTLCQLPSVYTDDGVLEVVIDAGAGSPVFHATVIVTLTEALAAVKAHPRH